jgi:hypothetical protein
VVIALILARNASTGLNTERILGEVTDGLLALEAAVSQTREGDLVVVVGHNVAAKGNLPVLKLASGGLVTSDQLHQIAGRKNRKIVIVCCWAQESGISGKITYSEAADITTSLDKIVAKAPSNVGVHLAFVCDQLPRVYGSVVSRRNAKTGVILVAVVGGGWAGYEFLVTPSGQRYVSFNPSK